MSGPEVSPLSLIFGTRANHRFVFGGCYPSGIGRALALNPFAYDARVRNGLSGAEFTPQRAKLQTFNRKQMVGELGAGLNRFIGSACGAPGEQVQNPGRSQATPRKHGSSWFNSVTQEHGRALSHRAFAGRSHPRDTRRCDRYKPAWPSLSPRESVR